MSLRLKIILNTIICISIIIFPLLHLLETSVKTTQLEQAEYQTLQLINSKSNEIGSWLNQRISEIRIVQEYALIKEMDLNSIKSYLTRLNKTLCNQYGNLNETFAIGGTDGKGWVNDKITIDISKRDYFMKVMGSDREYIISKPIISKSDGTPAFIICYPIVNDKNEKLGFINGAVNLEKIAEITNSIDVYNGISWIMNKDSDIYRIDKGNLTKKYISSEGLKKIAGELMKTDSGTIHLKDIAGKKSTVFFSAIPYTEDLILCTMIEDKYIHAQTNYIIKNVKILGITVLIFSVFFAIIVSGTIVKPINKLKEHMEEVSKGNLESFYNYKGNDEISSLVNGFNQMLIAIIKLIQQVYQVETQKRNAELRVLQSQINPHFLYNTLDTIQWMAIGHEAYDVADMVNTLSGFFRISLSNGKEFIPIQEEVEHVKYYLEIQKIRYKDRVNYDIYTEKSLYKCFVPKCSCNLG